MECVAGGEGLDGESAEIGGGDFLHGIADTQGAHIEAGGFAFDDESVVFLNAVPGANVNHGESGAGVHGHHAADGLGGAGCCGWLHGNGAGRGGCG